MKVIKTPDQSTEREIAYIKAHEGCDVCPYCGETKTALEYENKGIYNKGIIRKEPSQYIDGIIILRWVQEDRYKCRTCGTEWASEPFDRID